MESPDLRIRRVAIDTWRENVVYLHRDCAVVRAAGFQALSKVTVRADARSISAVLNVVDDETIVLPGELGLSEDAFVRLAVEAGRAAQVSPAEPPASLPALHRKIGGERLSREDLHAIVNDIAQARYSKIELAAFVVATNGYDLERDEVLYLTEAMIDAGRRLDWQRTVRGGPVVDKHCIGGIPGNRTSMLVVPIVTAHGMLCPKTSSRAITSPAGTADTMEVDTLTDAALRTLAEAYRPLTTGEDLGAAGALESELVFVGTVGNIDPPRPEAALAIRRARGPGIRVIMITGDHPRTAARIAADLGIVEAAAAALSGAELDSLDQTAFKEAVQKSSIFARVVPAHKLRIVAALQADGQTVAMTGDGVNDAPALAMGVDPSSDDVMSRVPRRRDARVIDARKWTGVVQIGAVMMLAQLFNCFKARSDRTSAFSHLFVNRWLWGSIALALLLQVAVLHLAFLNVAFGTVPVTLEQWALCTAMASAVLWASELRKLAVRTWAAR